MRNLNAVAVRTTVVLLLAACLAPPAHAQFDRLVRKRPAPRRAPTFEIGGVYTGVVNGTISIDGVGYPIAPNAPVYLIGTGPVPISMVPIGNRIYATGHGTLGSNVIEMLVARPINDESRSGTLPEVIVVPPNAPR